MFIEEDKGEAIGIKLSEPRVKDRVMEKGREHKKKGTKWWVYLL